MRKKVISIILVIVVVLSSVSLMSVTASANDNPKLYNIVSQYDEDGALYEYISDENGNILPLDAFSNKPQNDTLNTASVEDAIPSSYSSVTQGNITSIKSQGSFGTCWAHAFCASAESSLITQGYTDTSIDLSEAHLVWFRRHNYVDGSNNPVQRDYYSKVSDTFDHGGNTEAATATVARKSGLTTEKKFPYNGYNSSTMQFDQADIFECDYELLSSRLFVSDEKDEIKRSIMEYGALATSYYHSDSFYSSSAYSYYQNTKTGTNHGVAVVGWDDNYSASNFINPPDRDGAWLCKNSWGTWWGQNGYFWISYADTSISKFYEVVAQPAHDDNVYQYDGIGYGCFLCYTDKCYCANIFTAEKKENVRECSFYLGNNVDVTCTATLYADLDNPENPTSGIRITSNAIECTQKGFYRIILPNDYVLSPQEKFSIVISFETNQTGAEIYLPFEDGANTNATYYSESGQSFYSSSGRYWSDVDERPGLANAPIKAYTEDVEKRPISIEINTLPTKTSFIVGETFDYSGLTLNLVYSDSSIELIQNGFTVQADTSIIGTQDVIVSFNGFTATYPINVMENVPISISVASQSKNYYFINSTYEPEDLTLYVTFLNGDVQEITDGYTYKDVTFSSIGACEVNIYYAGLTAQTTVNVIPTQTLRPKDGSTTLVNNDNKTVSGLQSGLTNLNDYVVVDDGYSYTCQNDASSNIGTGTTISVYIGDEVIDTYSVIIFGDVTGDSFYDGQDALIIKCLVNNLNIPMPSVFIRAADCNHDGFVTAEDAAIAEAAGVYLTDIIQSDIIIEGNASNQLLAQNSVEFLQEEQPEETQNANWLICLIIGILDFIKSILKL